MYRIHNLQLRRKKHINYNTQKTNTRCKLRAYSISYFHCQISMQSATYPKIPRVGLELPVKIEKKMSQICTSNPNPQISPFWRW